jgi:hypothetical protein
MGPILVNMDPFHKQDFNLYVDGRVFWRNGRHVIRRSFGVMRELVNLKDIRRSAVFYRNEKEPPLF